MEAEISIDYAECASFLFRSPLDMAPKLVSPNSAARLSESASGHNSKAPKPTVNADETSLNPKP